MSYFPLPRFTLENELLIIHENRTDIYSEEFIIKLEKAIKEWRKRKKRK